MSKTQIEMGLLHRFLFISIFLISFLCVRASDPIFNKAVHLYQEGSYEESLELFQQLEAENIKLAELYYNIGNCFGKLNKVGYAVLYYERALKLQPRFKLAKENLRTCQNYIKEPVIPTEEFFFVRFYKQWIRPVHSGIWAVLSLISLTLAAGLYYIKISKQGFASAWIKMWVYLIFFSLIFGAFAAIVYRSENFDKYAIYMESAGVLKAAPSEQSDSIVNLSPGLKCLKVDQIGDWVQIRLMDYQHGWVRAASLERI